jgi:1-acyl-sn-glycerol-3-phosphate acyltransferase
VDYFLFRYNLIPLLWLRVKKIEGLENLPQNTNFIVAANHNSWIDSPIMAASLFYKIRKKVYFIASSIKWRFLGGLAISQKNKSKVLDKALELLKKGKILCLFPEGASNPKKTLLPGKTGVARLAIWSRLPIVPVGIIGTESKNSLRSFLSFWLFWREIVIKIGKPFNFDEFFNREINEDTLREATRKIMVSIASLCGKKPAEYIF